MVVAVVSGGNFDFERLPDVKERALRWEGRKKYYILRLPQRPGALRDFLERARAARRYLAVRVSQEVGAQLRLGAARHREQEPGGLRGAGGRMAEAGFGFQDITADTVITGLVV